MTSLILAHALAEDTQFFKANNLTVVAETIEGEFALYVVLPCGVKALELALGRSTPDTLSALRKVVQYLMEIDE